jgi:hypothetical protein
MSGRWGKKKGWKVNQLTLPNSNGDLPAPLDDVHAVPPPGNDDAAVKIRVGIGDTFNDIGMLAEDNWDKLDSIDGDDDDDDDDERRRRRDLILAMLNTRGERRKFQ